MKFKIGDRVSVILHGSWRRCDRVESIEIYNGRYLYWLVGGGCFSENELAIY